MASKTNGDASVIGPVLNGTATAEGDGFIFGVEGIASYLRVRPCTVQKFVREESLPVTMLGHRLVSNRDALRRWVLARMGAA